ncbi:MBL fold metallo-hydrolase [Halalkalibacillus sediminis]|uniref:MBL fold metallo-hydrolase n=1 Tax=Halalkalibacillus sediminis TaxID=2018042 RepID=A0A2I0QVL0_9BACI|nr:MBL fold metallo-hydrolase [Halalkalibacillus sediminis]PKR78365.1 MBL fold metallo-hydrolase [Halalkalibacillus sediminis]
MDMKQINEHCYYFSSSVNIGYVHEGDQGLIIDAGIDQSAIRKVVRQLEDHHLPITHLFITHAHADHYGGASYLRKKYGVKIIAPEMESAILNYPILEPIYMFSGNEPIEELRNKFLEGPPIDVDEVVKEGRFLEDNFDLELIATPGHSYYQLCVATHGVLFAADTYFGKKEIEKHKIPYITCATKTIESLNKLLDYSFNGAVPGHGEYEENYKETVRYNIEYHRKLLHMIYEIVQASSTNISHEELVREMCVKRKVKADQLSMFLLFRTAVTSYLTYWIYRGDIVHSIQQFRWVFHIKEEG